MIIKSIKKTDKEVVIKDEIESYWYVITYDGKDGEESSYEQLLTNNAASNLSKHTGVKLS